MPKYATRDRAIQDLIRERKDFQTYGSFYGKSVDGLTNWDMGRLPEQYYDSARIADYVVFSYATPIAWHNRYGWTMPNTKYSVTTTKHQSNFPGDIVDYRY